MNQSASLMIMISPPGQYNGSSHHAPEDVRVRIECIHGNCLKQAFAARLAGGFRNGE